MTTVWELRTTDRMDNSVTTELFAAKEAAIASLDNDEYFDFEDMAEDLAAAKQALRDEGLYDDGCDFLWVLSEKTVN